MARGKHKAVLNRSAFTVTGHTPKPKKKHADLPLWKFLRLAEQKMSRTNRKD